MTCCYLYGYFSGRFYNKNNRQYLFTPLFVNSEFYTQTTKVTITPTGKTTNNHILHGKNQKFHKVYTLSPNHFSKHNALRETSLMSPISNTEC